MGNITFSGINLTPLPRIKVVGGDVLRAMKASDFGFSGFGEAYFSMVNNGAIKAWKRHNKMTMNLIVPCGAVKFVFCSKDERGVNAFNQIIIGEDSYERITVQPGIWFGFKGLGSSESLILNISDIEHSSSEVDRIDVDEISFDWSD